jgi:hypothetical protein
VANAPVIIRRANDVNETSDLGAGNFCKISLLKEKEREERREKRKERRENREERRDKREARSEKREKRSF